MQLIFTSIAFNWYKQVKSSNSSLNIVPPGQKLSCYCRKKAKSMVTDNPETSSSKSELDEIHKCIDADTSPSLNESLQKQGESSVKLYAATSGRKTG